MSQLNSEFERLAFLRRVVRKESEYLAATDARLFTTPMTLEVLARFETDIDVSERADAFVSRFGRLQDTLADKLLPALLRMSAESVGSAINNLDKAERFGWVASVDDWLTMRRLRNQMVHEYIEDLSILCDALNAGHDFVSVLQESAGAMIAAVDAILARDTAQAPS